MPAWTPASFPAYDTVTASVILCLDWYYTGPAELGGGVLQVSAQFPGHVQAKLRVHPEALREPFDKLAPGAHRRTPNSRALTEKLN